MPNEQSTTVAFDGWTDKQQSLATRLKAHKEQTELSWANIATKVGKTGSTISQFAHGTYPSPDSIEEIVARYLDALDTEVDLEQFAQIVDTRTNQEVQTHLQYAQTLSTIAVVAGAPGVGKTVACQQFIGKGNNRFLVTASPAQSSVNSVLTIVAEALGLAVASNNSSNAANIVRRLRGTQGIIIIDEAQHLSRGAIEQLRSMRDATNDTVAIALVGNAKVGSAFTDTTTRADFAQIRSRVGIRFNRTSAYQQDAFALARHWNMEEHRTTLWEIAKRDGGLRWAAQVAKLASIMATSKTVSSEDIDAAAKMVGVTA